MKKYLKLISTSTILLFVALVLFITMMLIFHYVVGNPIDGFQKGALFIFITVFVLGLLDDFKVVKIR